MSATKVIELPGRRRRIWPYWIVIVVLALSNAFFILCGLQMTRSRNKWQDLTVDIVAHPDEFCTMNGVDKLREAERIQKLLADQ
jgi:hypothetical protein